MVDKIYEPYLREENYPPVFFMKNRADGNPRTDIIEYVDQMCKWVTDGGIEEEWISIKQLNNMGRRNDRFTRMYDRYKAAN